MDQCQQRFLGKRSTHCSQVKIANLTQFAHLTIHDEPRVQVNSKVVDGIGRLQDGVDGWHVALTQEVASAQPDELRLVGVESKPVGRHPSLHGADDVHGPGGQVSSIRGLTRAMKLGIVGIQMYTEPERYDQF